MGRKSRNKRLVSTVQDVVGKMDYDVTRKGFEVGTDDDIDLSVHMWSKKRRRKPKKAITRKGENRSQSRACDQFICNMLADGNHRDYYKVIASGKKGILKRVWNSWFVDEVEWISHETIGNEDEYNENLHENSESMLEEFFTNSSKLTEIKKRLWPMAMEVSKVISDETPSKVFSKARQEGNAFETLGEGREGGLNRMFTNRSAIKLANLNALLDFSLTPSSKKLDGDEVFTFVDLCGAPGGWSEYIMHICHKASIPCHGWGISLIGHNHDGNGCNWKLEHMITRDGGLSTRYRVSEGVDGSGDIYAWENIEFLQKEIIQDMSEMGTSHYGKVSLVLADGGMDSQRNVDNQEEVTFRLVVCEISAALLILKPGGTFLLKYFGAKSKSTKIAFAMLFRSFEKVSVVKPILSRPASAERYIVCKNFKPLAVWEGKVDVWRETILNGNYQEEIDETVEKYLMKKDFDVLNLNLRACFDILTYMERAKNNALLNKGSSIRDRTVDIHQYRQAWKVIRARRKK